MKTRPLRTTMLSALLLTMLIALAMCRSGPVAPAAPAPPATTQPQPAAQPTTLPPTASPPATPPPTASPPPATIPPTHTATTAPTNTAPPTATATVAPSATPTIAPTQKPSDTPTPAPHAIVTGETLNVRSGPDTQFEAVARLSRGDALTVVGQSGGCAWLKVLTAQGALGWVARQSGGVELVKLNLPCAEIPALSVPTPTARPALPTQPPAQPTQQPRTSQPGLPADKGCYLFQNFMGAELNVTLGGSGLSDNFKIPANGERLYCLAPGRYNYTIDAPPPWADINGSLDVQAGKHFRFPIQGRP